jgi:hypothetical protein
LVLKAFEVGGSLLPSGSTHFALTPICSIQIFGFGWDDYWTNINLKLYRTKEAIRTSLVLSHVQHSDNVAFPS